MRLNKRGFSLVEIMVAAAMLGAVSLGVMSLQKNMKKGEVISETKMEELELRRLITTLLTDQLACKNTFLGSNIGSPITQIKNSAGSVVYQTDNTYGNNTVKITSMSTQDLGIVNSDNTRVVNLNITLQKMKQMAGGTSKTTSIQLNVAAPSANGAITSCNVDANQIISAANIASCASLNGTWNSTSSTCTLDYFVKKSGDTMTGTLETTKVTSPQFCTGTNCKAIEDLALANQNCTNKNEVQIGVNSNGTPKCLQLSCGANQYFSGIDSSSGNIICKTIPSKDCGAGAYVSLVNADGSIECASTPVAWDADCGAGKVLQKVTSNGTKVCVNKGGNKTCSTGDFVSAVAADGTVTCTTPATASLNISCPSGQVLTGINAGAAVCMANNSFYGMYRQGNKYNSATCTMPNHITGTCTCPSGSSAVIAHSECVSSNRDGCRVTVTLFLCI